MNGNRHGQPNRTHAGRWLSALALGLFSLNTHAGYAQATPPAGWSPGTGAGATYRAAANEAWLSSTVRTNAALNVGGKAVQVPATMRLAANAPRFAARFLFANPYVAIGSVVLTAWLGSQKLFWDSEQGKWVKETPGTEQQQTQWEIQTNSNPGGWFTSAQAACQASAQARWGTLAYGVDSGTGFCRIYFTSNNSYWNGYGYNYRSTTVTVPGDPIRTPIGDTEFEEKMAPTTLPDSAPNIIPMPWPVEMPKLNPIPSPDGHPQPLRIPTGDPYKLPNTDPAEYRRPAIDIVPSPTPQSPWRVDVQPKEIPVPDLQPRPLPPPVPVIPPVPVPTPDPNAPPQPDVDPNAPPEAGEKTEPDLCEKNPEILACQKPELDTPDQDIPRKNFAVTFAAETLFGTGSCPANRTMTLRGQTLTVWDFSKTCDYLTLYLKPVIILLATFAAFMIISPGKDA